MNQSRTKLQPKDFIKLVRNSRILSDQQLEFWLNKINCGDSRIRKSTVLLSQDLIESELLTAWQTKKLLAGKFKGFFVGQFKVLDHIGTGGMSSVYLAQHSITGQQRAIKVLPQDKIAEKSYLPRFYREAQAVASLVHPNIVRIYDVAKENNLHYMVMEYVAGKDLHQAVTNNGPLSYAEAESCILQSARGLSYAHQNAIVHRDIKPANLVLTDKNKIKILDLGLALLKSDQTKFGISAQHDESMMGTVDFLSPEQANDSHSVDHRADIYSLGCTLYFLLTGQPPFATGSLAERIAAHQSLNAPTISDTRSDCPPYIESIYQKMMAKNPDQRFDNCLQIENALLQKQPIQQQTAATPKTDTTTQPKSIKKPTRKKPTAAIWLVIASLLLVTGLIAAFVYRGSPSENPPNASAESNRPRGNSPKATTADKIASNTVDPPNSVDPVSDLPPSVAPTGESILDFNYPETFARSQIKTNWFDLFADRQLYGHLVNVSRKQIESIKISGEATNCLALRGIRQIEFRPSDTQPLTTLEKITLVAHADKKSDNFKVVIEGKNSISGPEPWKKILDITTDLDTENFSQILLDTDLFTTMKYRKFRFNVTGKPTDGFYIQSVSIRLRSSSSQ